MIPSPKELIKEALAAVAPKTGLAVGADLAKGDAAYHMHKKKKENEAALEAQYRAAQKHGPGEGQSKMAAKTPAWTRSEGKSKSGGLNAKGVASYRRENPGSKLQTAVTTKPSKLKPGSKAAKRRKSFCARMSGMPGPMKDEKGRPTRKALSLRKWNC